MDELSRRRRAIYTALLNCYDESNATLGVELWNREFSNKPLFALQPYISRLFEVIDIEVSRAELQRYILSALSLDNNSLEHDPLAQSTDASSEIAASEIIHDVFRQMMSRIVAGLKKEYPIAEPKIKISLIDRMDIDGLSRENLQNIKVWLSGDADLALAGTLTLSQMQKLFHYLYLTACEELGPVATDKLVAEIVHETEQLPESGEFSPKNFF